MATHQIAGSARGARAKTLTGSAHDTVIIGRECEQVEVLHHGNVTDPLYFVAQCGSAPADFAAAADVTEVVLAGSSLVVDAIGSGDTYVKLISAGAVTYSVTGSRS